MSNKCGEIVFNEGDVVVVTECIRKSNESEYRKLEGHLGEVVGEDETVEDYCWLVRIYDVEASELECSTMVLGFSADELEAVDSIE